MRHERETMGNRNRGDLQIIGIDWRAGTLELGANSAKLTRRPGVTSLHFQTLLVIPLMLTGQPALPSPGRALIQTRRPFITQGNARDFAFLKFQKHHLYVPTA